jgi:hypothetical protein
MNTNMTRMPTSLPQKDTAPARSAALAQRDLFYLDSPLTSEIRSERSLMAFPFFALSKTAWMRPLTYQHANVAIEVRPSAKGVATIYDKEIVLYIASLMAGKIERGEEVGQDFIFTAHDLFPLRGRTIRRAPTSGCPRRWSGCRIRRSRPISRRAGKGRRASSRGCPRRGCTIPRPAPASAA